MINIVFEGPTGAGKTTLINKIKNIYEVENYKVGNTVDIDNTSPLYETIYKMFKDNALVSLNEEFSTIRYETLIQAADYLYLREKLYSNNNDINLFDRNYASIYSYQSVLYKKSNNDKFMENVLNCMKSGERKIDLMIFFRTKIKKAIKRSEKRDNRKYNIEEKQTLTEFNEKLTDFIRYNNSNYKLITIEDNENIDDSTKKIKEEIDLIIKNKKKNEANIWYELYKADIDEYKNSDEYIQYKIQYKSKFISKIIKYSENKNILEAGCGTGLIAGFLKKKGYDVVAMDLSDKVLEYANNLAEMSNIIEPCIYKKGNILERNFQTKKFGVVYSNGVLEHFNDEQIIKILNNQLKEADFSIFGVPSTYWKMNEKMYGNERSLKKEEWINLIKKAGGKVVEFGGFDYWKLNRRITEVKKWFQPKAFWFFVIKEDKKEA